jgi:hypothetical protein
MKVMHVIIKRFPVDKAVYPIEMKVSPKWNGQHNNTKPNRMFHRV